MIGRGIVAFVAASVLTLTSAGTAFGADAATSDKFAQFVLGEVQRSVRPGSVKSSRSSLALRSSRRSARQAVRKRLA
jgi:hypothetical protein